jgi:predicted kinase
MNENVNRNVVRNAPRSNSNAPRPSRRARPSPHQLRALQGSQISADRLVENLTAKRGGRLVLLIGLPASGKSTISEAFEAAGWLRLNKDSLRKELYGDESILGDGRAVSRLFYSRLEEGMKAGRNILVDNTNVSPLHRKGPLAMAAEHGYPVALHVFLDVPVEECMRRNALRERKVPEVAFRELAAALAWPGGIPSRREGQLIVLNPGDSRSTFLLKRVRLHGRRRVKPE